MRDLFLDGLPILDALEIGASTAMAAHWLNCDQSSISRTYRRASEQLGLNFRKTNGHYQAATNLALLETLRQASQLRRLNSQGLQLQWLLHPALELPYPLATLKPPPKPPLSCPWPQPKRMLELLHRRVVDLAVMPSKPGLDLLVVADTRVTRLNPKGPWHALVRHDLHDHCCIGQLLLHLGSALN